MRPVVLEEDLDGIIELARVSFGEEPAPQRWRWKYSPPWAKRRYSWLGLQGEATVAHIGAVPLRGQMDGRKRPFFQIGDIMLHPELRGKVNWTAAPEQVLRDILEENPDAVLYGFADRRTFEFYRYLDVAALVDEVREFVVQADDSICAAMDEDIDIRKWDWEDPNIDPVWSARAPEIRCGLVRNAEYLRWRYCAHPAFRYCLLGVRRQGVPLGWVVQLQNNREQREGRAWIVDMLLPNHLMQGCLEAVARTLEVRSVSLWLPSWFRREFNESRPSGMVLMSWKSSLQTEYLKNHHYFTAGDADIF